MATRKSWTPEEDSRLIEAWSADEAKSASEIASLFMVSEYAVRARVGALGARRSKVFLHAQIAHRVSGRANPRSSWTDFDEQKLRTLWETDGLSLLEIRRLMPSRTRMALKVKAGRLGLRHTREQTAQILSRLLSGDQNGMFGKSGPRLGIVMSDALKEKIRVVALTDFASGKRVPLTGSMNPMFGKSSPMRGKSHTDFAKRATGAKVSKFWAERPEEQKNAHLLALRQGWARWVKLRNPTWIERLVGQWLSDFGASFQAEQTLQYYVVDFLVSGRVVETHGDYWHANPVKYDPLKLDAVQRANVVRDRRKATYCRNKGIPLLTLWESDLSSDPDGCRQRLLGFLA